MYDSRYGQGQRKGKEKVRGKGHMLQGHKARQQVKSGLKNKKVNESVTLCMTAGTVRSKEKR